MNLIRIKNAGSPKRLAATAIGLMASVIASQAFDTNYTVITFDVPPVNGHSEERRYVESGFQFQCEYQGRQFNTFDRYGGGVYSQAPDNGTTYIAKNIGSIVDEQLTFSRTDGTSFGLESVDAAELTRNPLAPMDLTFNGIKLDGSTVSMTFHTDGISDGNGPLNDFQTFQFDDRFYSDITKVFVVREIGYYNYAFDNLTVINVVPEPTSLGLLTAGAALLFWGRRVSKRRKD